MFKEVLDERGVIEKWGIVVDVKKQRKLNG